MQVGAASMIPPPVRKTAMDSDQLLNKEGIAIWAFLGKYFAIIGLICSTKSMFWSIYFFFNIYRGLI